jgi:hypothetical protein
LQSHLAEIESVLSEPVVEHDWATQVNRAGLEILQAKYTGAVLAHSQRARLRFRAGQVVGTAAPAHLLLRFVLDVNDAVVAVANRRLPRPSRKIDDAARDRLGLWVFAPQPGSVIVDVAAPPAGPIVGTQEIPGVDQVESITERALVDVLDALESATGADITADGLAAHLAPLGSIAIAHVDRIALRAERGDFSVLIESQGRAGSRQFEFRPRDATFLRRVIKNRALAVQTRNVVGVLQTASLRRSMFDILVDGGGELITGATPVSIRPTLAPMLGRRVRAVVEERMDDSDPDSGKVKRKLVEIAIAEDPATGSPQLRR